MLGLRAMSCKSWLKHFILIISRSSTEQSDIINIHLQISTQTLRMQNKKRDYYIKKQIHKDFRSQFICVYLPTASWFLLNDQKNPHIVLCLSNDGGEILFVLTIEDDSSGNSLQINADKLTSEQIFVHKALHWALYHVWFRNIMKL